MPAQWQKGKRDPFLSALPQRETRLKDEGTQGVSLFHLGPRCPPMMVTRGRSIEFTSSEGWQDLEAVANLHGLSKELLSSGAL